MDTNFPLISVIVPIYNVETYLKQCINSVLQQSYTNIEVILVDDGSPDTCPQICDEYAKQDSRIQVIHKENGGLSDARNVGITSATGDYLVCLDSDDYWKDESSLASLVEVLQSNNCEVDIIMFGRTVFEEGSDKTFVWPTLDLQRINGKNKLEVLTYLTEIGNLYTSACNKLVKRRLLDNIEFERGLLSEDLDWSLNVYLKADRFFAVNNPFYCYRKRAGSITTSMKEKNFSDLLYIISKWSNKLSGIHISEPEKKIYYGFLCYEYCILIGLLSKGETSVRNKIRKEMKPYEWILKYDCNYKTHLVCKLYKAFGFDITCRLLSVYLKHSIKAKRILLIINGLQTGGGETVVSELAKKLNENYILCVLLLQKTDSGIYNELVRNGVCVLELNNSSVYNPLKILQLRKFLPFFDVVHVNLFPSLYWASIAKKMCTTKSATFVYTEHSTHNRRRDKRLFKLLDKWVYSEYDQIVGISEKASSNLISYLPMLAGKVSTINNGIDIAKFTDAKPIVRAEIGLNETDFVLIQVANFRQAKDQATVIRSMKMLPKYVKAVFVGAGQNMRYCQELSEKEKVADRCLFLGKRTDIAQLLKMANVVVMSSHWEGFGLAAVEGMATGKPIVASDIDGLREVVEGAGVLFPQGDEATLADNINRLISDHEYFLSVTDKCKIRANCFDIKKMVDEYLKVYEFKQL